MTILQKPVLGPCNSTPWYFQEDAVNAARNEFKRGIRSTYVVMPTGSGKTFVFGYATRKTVEKGGRVLILVNTDILCSQAVNKLDHLGVEAAVEKAGSYARACWEPDVVVGSVQTMKGERLRSWPRDYFKLVIPDECHRVVAPSYQEILTWFAPAWRLGVTATPNRADGQSIKSVFQTEAYQISMLELMTAPSPGPYLCRLKMVRKDLGIDLREIRKTKEDY